MRQRETETAAPPPICLGPSTDQAVPAMGSKAGFSGSGSGPLGFGSSPSSSSSSTTGRLVVRPMARMPL
eukprot:scaffold7419_cov137-Isochrysis_galbana.AAC.2